MIKDVSQLGYLVKAWRVVGSNHYLVHELPFPVGQQEEAWKKYNDLIREYETAKTRPFDFCAVLIVHERPLACYPESSGGF